MKAQLIPAPFRVRDEKQNKEIIFAAVALVEKLSILTWRDRDICFKEWDALVEALNLLPASFI